MQNFGDGSLTRIDPSSERAASVRDGGVSGIAADGPDLWIAEQGNRLTRLDGATGTEEHRIDLGSEAIFAVGDAGFLTVGGGSIWLTVPKLGDERAPQSLWRIDPASGRVLSRIPIDAEPIPPFYADGLVWVVTPTTLHRIDIASSRPSELEVGNGPFGIASGDGSVWVGHESPTEVWRIDPESGRPSAKIVIGEAARGLAFGGGRVWATTGTGLTSIDPAMNRAGRKLVLTDARPDEGPTGVAYLDGSVWVSVE